MTNIDTDRKVEKHDGVRRFVQRRWFFLALGLAAWDLGRTYFRDRVQRFFIEGAIGIAVFASLILYSRLRSRALSRKLRNPSEISSNERRANQPETTDWGSRLERSGLDFWTLAIPLSIVLATQFARDQHWLGGNVPERTNWIVILGLVFICGMSRMWWKNRKQHEGEVRGRHEHDES